MRSFCYLALPSTAGISLQYLSEAAFLSCRYCLVSVFHCFYALRGEGIFLEMLVACFPSSEKLEKFIGKLLNIN